MEDYKLPAEVSRVLLGASSHIDESQTKQFLILPVLASLGWNVFNREEVWPEYRRGFKKFDLALRHNKELCVVIEAKRLGSNLAGHKKQLLDYSFEAGVKVAILTDGKMWWFYLPILDGHWENRFVVALNLTNSAHVQQLPTFLSAAAIQQGSALENLTSAKLHREEKHILRTSLTDTLMKLPNNQYFFRGLTKYIANTLKVSEEASSQELRIFLSALGTRQTETSTRVQKPTGIQTLKATAEPKLVYEREVIIYGRKLLFKEASQVAIAASVLIGLSVFFSNALQFNRKLQSVLKKYYAERTSTAQQLIEDYHTNSFKKVKIPEAKIQYCPRSRYQPSTIASLIRDLQEATRRQAKSTL
jgi:hypothetical protein